MQRGGLAAGQHTAQGDEADGPDNAPALFPPANMVAGRAGTEIHWNPYKVPLVIC